MGKGKRIIYAVSFCLVVILFCFCISSLRAPEDPGFDSKAWAELVDTPLTRVVAENVDPYWTEALEAGRISAAGVDVSALKETPVLCVYEGIPWGAFEKDIDALVSYAKEDLQTYYVPMDGSFVYLTEQDADSAQKEAYWRSGKFQDQNVQVFLNTIQKGKKVQKFIGIGYPVIEKIVCFTDSVNDISAVIYITDKGVYVRVYENYYDIAETPVTRVEVFEWTEFQEYAREYEAYKLLYHFDENGNSPALPLPHFLEFADRKPYLSGEVMFE